MSYAIKVDSRLFLPLEMLLGLKLAALGVTGGLLNGTIYKALMAIGENRSWMVVLCAVGVAQFLTALLTLLYGREASLPALYRIVNARMALGLASMVTWIYCLFLIVELGAIWQAVYFLTMAPVALTFHGWTVFENRKVSCGLDASIPTTRLAVHR